MEALAVRRGKNKGKLLAKIRPEIQEQLKRLGRERALIYKTMVLTGLRKGELASLTVGQLHMNGDLPYVALNASDEKSREGNDIPLRHDLAQDLRDWLSSKAKEQNSDNLRTVFPTCTPSMSQSFQPTQRCFTSPTS